MTKNEALKAAIDGKKVKYHGWVGDECLYFRECGFVFKDKKDREFINDKIMCILSGYNDGEWEIVPEYVDFATAWKAYEEGKTIQSTSSGEKYQNKQCGAFIRIDSIRGKWLILEDNS